MCRSPLAEGLLKVILKNRNIQATVDSAGFEAYHIKLAVGEQMNK